MHRFEATDEHGNTMEYQTYGGLTFETVTAERLFPAKNLKLQMEWIQEMEIRPDDVILCAYPKSGTHWLWEVVSMLLKGTAEYERSAKEVAMLEFCTKEMVADLPSPRVLNTHNPHHLLPTGVKDKRCKIIHMQRNPKDVATSLFYHMKSFPLLAGNVDVTFSQLLKTFTGQSGIPFICSWFDYVKSYEDFGRDNPEYPFLTVNYERLKMNPKEEIKALATFLDVKATGELIEDIANKCDFQNLKKANRELKDDPTSKKTKDGESPMYRKGIIGDWKNHFTVAESEAFDSHYAKEMGNFHQEFIFEEPLSYQA